MRADFAIGGGLISVTSTLEAGESPYLLGVGTMRVAARAGQTSGLGVGESPNATIQLQNAEQQAARLLYVPLRVPVTLRNDDDTIFFEGIVSKVSCGKIMTLTIQS